MEQIEDKIIHKILEFTRIYISEAEAKLFLAFLKTEGYAKMAKNQTLPEIPRKEIAHIIMERDRILLKGDSTGVWRKVEEIKDESDS